MKFLKNIYNIILFFISEYIRYRNNVTIIYGTDLYVIKIQTFSHKYKLI